MSCTGIEASNGGTRSDPEPSLLISGRLWPVWSRNAASAGTHHHPLSHVALETAPPLFHQDTYQRNSGISRGTTMSITSKGKDIRQEKLAAVLLALCLSFAIAPGASAAVISGAPRVAAVAGTSLVEPVRCYSRRVCDRRGCRSVRRCSRPRCRSRRVCDWRGCRSVRNCW
jgi:hypothetical protein